MRIVDLNWGRVIFAQQMYPMISTSVCSVVYSVQNIISDHFLVCGHHQRAKRLRNTLRVFRMLDIGVALAKRCGNCPA